MSYLSNLFRPRGSLVLSAIGGVPVCLWGFLLGKHFFCSLVSLKSLAYNTGGEYFNIKNKQDLKSSFDQIIKITEKTGSIDMTFYLIMVVIILFIIKQFLLSINKIIW